MARSRARPSGQIRWVSALPARTQGYVSHLSLPNYSLGKQGCALA
jgi:hypothetical protein